MITYQQERLIDIRPEIEAAIPQLWEEMAASQGGFEQFVEKTNWDWYLKLDAAGKAVFFTAREAAPSQNAGQMVGWFGVYVYQSTSSDNLMVQATPYYVFPLVGPLRRGLILRKLIKFALAKVALPGAMVTIKTHVWSSAAPILEHLGFRAVETWYMLAVPPPSQAATADRPQEASDARDSGCPRPSVF